MIKTITAAFAVTISCLCFATSSSAQSDSTLQEPTVPQELRTFEPRLSPPPELEKTSSAFLSEIEAETDEFQIRYNTDSGRQEKLPPLETAQLEVPGKQLVSQKLVNWKSDDFRHRHLLFEERDYERHGVPNCKEKKQLFRSGTRFFSRALFLPFTAATKKPLNCQCAPGK
jgi:hypothetical protein